MEKEKGRRKSEKLYCFWIGRENMFKWTSTAHVQAAIVEEIQEGNPLPPLS